MDQNLICVKKCLVFALNTKFTEFHSIVSEMKYANKTFT